MDLRASDSLPADIRRAIEATANEILRHLSSDTQSLDTLFDQSLPADVRGTLLRRMKAAFVDSSDALLADELRSFRGRLGAVGGWVFAAEKNPEVPMDRHLFDKWLVVAEQEAGLLKLDGGLWHAYRRKWATERKHLPLKDVAAAGGWNDVDTLLNVYQQPDPQTRLAVMSEPRKVSETLAATM